MCEEGRTNLPYVSPSQPDARIPRELQLNNAARVFYERIRGAKKSLATKLAQMAEATGEAKGGNHDEGAKPDSIRLDELDRMVREAFSGAGVYIPEGYKVAELVFSRTPQGGKVANGSFYQFLRPGKEVHVSMLQGLKGEGYMQAEFVGNSRGEVLKVSVSDLVVSVSSWLGQDRVTLTVVLGGQHEPTMKVFDNKFNREYVLQAPFDCANLQCMLDRPWRASIQAVHSYSSLLYRVQEEILWPEVGDEVEFEGDWHRDNDYTLGRVMTKYSALYSEFEHIADWEIMGVGASAHVWQGEQVAIDLKQLVSRGEELLGREVNQFLFVRPPSSNKLVAILATKPLLHEVTPQEIGILVFDATTGQVEEQTVIVRAGTMPSDLASHPYDLIQLIKEG